MMMINERNFYSVLHGEISQAIHNQQIHKYAALRENLSSGFQTRSNTNRAIQPQKMAGGLKLRI